MTDRERLEATIRELYARQGVGVLCARGDRYPHASLVAFAPSEDLRTILFATLRQARKYGYIVHDPHVVLTVDSRTETNADLLRTVVATASGIAEEIPLAERSGWKDVYLRRHPSLLAFVESPDCALMAIRVQSYEVITDFQTVAVLPF